MKHARSCFFPAAALAALYRRRWQIERNFDDLKASLGMNHLACQSTDMALRLVAMDQCAYNLIRALMQHPAGGAHVPGAACRGRGVDGFLIRRASFLSRWASRPGKCASGAPGGAFLTAGRASGSQK